MNAAARAYGANLRNKRGTKSSFGSRPPRTNLPKADPAPGPSTAKPDPPSYGFVDTQKGSADTTAEKDASTDAVIEKEHGRADEADHTDKPKKAMAKNEVKENQPSTEPHTVSRGPAPAFNHFWHLVKDYQFEQLIFEETNYYTPNSIAMFKLLDAAHELLNGNRFMAKHHPEYVPYAVDVYFAIIFYLQILRAQFAAKRINPDDSRFMRNFFRVFPEESLPIPAFMQPYFDMLIATELPLTKFDWIVPKIVHGLYQPRQTISTMTDNANKYGGYFLQPLVPQMLGVLRYMMSETNKVHMFDTMAAAGFGTSTTDAAYYHDDTGDWCPGNFTAGGTTTIFGINFVHGTNPRHGDILMAQGLNQRTWMDGNAISVAIPTWKNSDFTQVHWSIQDLDATIDRRHSQNIDNDTPIETLANFLHWESNGPNTWFRKLIDNVALFCRFFGETTNLSNIATVGGYEPTICADMKFITQRRSWGKRSVATATETNYTAGTLNDTDFDWFKTTLKSPVGSFYTTRYGVEREHELQAYSFAVNATLPIAHHHTRQTGAGAPVLLTTTVKIGDHGDAQIQLARGTSGTATTTRVVRYRDGPYWEDGDYSFTQKMATGEGIPLFEGWTSLLQSHFYQTRPAGF